MEESEIIKKLGVVGKRLQLELKGYKCLPIEKNKKSKKEIQVSRSFGTPCLLYTSPSPRDTALSRMPSSA